MIPDLGRTPIWPTPTRTSMMNATPLDTIRQGLAGPLTILLIPALPILDGSTNF